MVFSAEELREIAKQFPDIERGIQIMVGEPSIWDGGVSFGRRSDAGAMVSRTLLDFANEVAKRAIERQNNQVL